MSNFEESAEMKTGEQQKDGKKIIDHGDWQTVIDENEPGLFRVKHFCKYCGMYNTYGTPPFCMYCGHKMHGKII